MVMETAMNFTKKVTIIYPGGGIPEFKVTETGLGEIINAMKTGEVVVLQGEDYDFSPEVHMVILNSTAVILVKVDSFKEPSRVMGLQSTLLDPTGRPIQ